MDRKELDSLLLDERYNSKPSEDSKPVDNPQYAEAKSAFDELDRILEYSEDEPPRPGFDTRFYARLKDVQTSPDPEENGWLERLIWLLLPIGALVVVAMTLSSGSDVFEAISSSRDMGLAMELELLEDYEVIRDLDEVVDFELLAQLNLADFEGLDSPGIAPENEEATVQ